MFLLNVSILKIILYFMNNDKLLKIIEIDKLHILLKYIQYSVKFLMIYFFYIFYFLIIKHVFNDILQNIYLIMLFM